MATASDARPIGLVYQPPGGQMETFVWDEVAHLAPSPDPDSRYRGMSCLRPILKPVANSDAYMQFIAKFWQNAATPNAVIQSRPRRQKRRPTRC